MRQRECLVYIDILNGKLPFKIISIKTFIQLGSKYIGIVSDYNTAAPQKIQNIQLSFLNVRWCRIHLESSYRSCEGLALRSISTRIIIEQSIKADCWESFWLGKYSTYQNIEVILLWNIGLIKEKRWRNKPEY